MSDQPDDANTVHSTDKADELAALRQFEQARITARRALHGIAPPADDEVALALSGGGIRSATFSLGVLRALSSLSILQRLDYLSTVSGGSYIGSFLGGLYASRGASEKLFFDNRLRLGLANVPPRSAPKVDAPLLNGNDGKDPLGTEKVTQALNWLRQSGRYLAPRGSGDYLYFLTIMTRNWFGVQLVFGAAMLLVALLAVAFRMALHDQFPDIFASVISPIFAIAAVPATMAAAFAWSYWLTRREAASRWTLPVPALAGSALVIGVAGYVWKTADAEPLSAAYVGLTGVMAVLFWAIAAYGRLRHVDDAPATFKLARAWDLIRQDLTKWQARLVRYTLFFVVVAVLDTAAVWVWTTLVKAEWSMPVILFGSPLAGIGLVPVAHWLLKRFEGDVANNILSKIKALGIKTLSAIIALLLLVLIAVSWGIVAYVAGAIAFDGLIKGLPKGWSAFGSMVLIIAGLNLAIGYVAAFINLSSLATFYAGRLRRAYLGASNQNRFRFDQRTAVDKAESNDEIAVTDYFGAVAAPLHLINITLNETQSRGSNLVQQERHGRNLVLSPSGIIYTRGDSDRLHRTSIHSDLTGAAPEQQDLARGFPAAAPGEPIPMSSWVAISGAAFSTGLGAQTNFGMSVLAGLANLRLGYWWNRSRTPPWERILAILWRPTTLAQQIGRWWVGMPKWWADLLRYRPYRMIQGYLLDELRGRYAGAEQQRWYLTDGGHFENLAVYELIRRELPLVICCDNGEDPLLRYDDLAGLVRKARIDFGAEIVFLGEDALNQVIAAPALRKLFRAQNVPLEKLDADNPSVAMLARIKYRSDKTGTLLLIKPRLTGDGPVDLRHYQAGNPSFPHQPTIDQFFDEAQWESYYKLGQLITHSLFAAKQIGGGWYPAQLRNLPV